MEVGDSVYCPGLVSTKGTSWKRASVLTACVVEDIRTSVKRDAFGEAVSSIVSPCVRMPGADVMLGRVAGPPPAAYR